MEKTELMKRYEAETGKRAKKKVLVMYSTKRYGWGREKNHLFFTNKFVKWLMNLLDYFEVENNDANRRIATLESNVGMYKYENAQLKAQLTWRPVSEKPEKDGNYLVVVDVQGEPLECTSLFLSGEWEEDNVVKWLPIPPALEGE